MTPEQKAKQNFRIKGEAVSDWAAAHGFHASLVYAVLSGQRKCYRGKSRQIAQLLGLNTIDEHLKKGLFGLLCG
jgi:gp16 family phage-associated protein